MQCHSELSNQSNCRKNNIHLTSTVYANEATILTSDGSVELAADIGLSGGFNTPAMPRPSPTNDIEAMLLIAFKVA